ncbi:hypothetical protein ACFOLJ_04125 [Rugamonas sp. CCM 8940]|uniref:hypothetical protein n=1 Tax=Rugamonas sp. CCM 8940 TaxID=2765359 RepID=UPI0018F74E56|nr:hypothetical protein [Rugamonas sp. CCM 8940]MBJ7312101.1 hypothetical protein [Rugamonas sp. CCM 8940]
MAKDDDFIMRRCQDWDIGLYNNSPGANNATKPIHLATLPKKISAAAGPASAWRGRL